MIRRTTPLSFAITHTAGLALLLFGLFVSPAYSASSIQLTWDPSQEPDLKGYSVYMGTSSGSYPTTKDAGLTPSFIFQNLTEGKKYYFTVTAYDQSGNISEPAQEVAIALPTPGGNTPPPDTTSPSVPSALQATSLSTTEIRLNWAPSTDDVGVTSYTISRNGTNVASVSTTSFTDQALSPSTTYSYKVTAHDAAGNASASSAPTSATTRTPLDTTPPSIALVGPQNGTSLSGTITVSATATDNMSVMGVQFHLQGANLGLEDTTNAYSTNWNTTTVPNGSYTLTATARDAAGNTTTAAPITVTVSNTSTPPTSLPTSSLSLSNLTVASGQSYVVPASGLQVGGTVYRDRSYTFTSVPALVQGAAYIQTANEDKAATTAAFLSFQVNQPVTVYVAHDVRITPKPSWVTTFTDTGKNLETSDTTLHLFTRAFPAGTITLGGNAGSEYSMYSVLVQPQDGSVPPLDTTSPSVPQKLTLNSTSDTQVTFSWTASTDNIGVTGYEVARNNVVIGQPTTNAFVDKTTGPGMTYQYTVKARDANGNVSAGSTPLQVTTPQTLAQQLMVSTSGNGSITSIPNGINCPRRNCTGTYPTGTVVTLTATPRKGWSFSGWSGSCTGTGPCSLTLTENRTVNANFSKNSR